MIKQLMIVQFKTLIREPGVLFWVFGFPVLIAWVLGVAFSGDQVTNHTIGWVGDPSVLQENPRFDSVKGGFRLTEVPPNADLLQIKILTLEEAIERLKRGELSLIVTAEANHLTTQMDLKNAEAKVSFLLLKAGLEAQKFKIKINKIKIKGGQYIDFLVPGLMALGIMNSCIWGIGWATIELRMKKLLRRMIATPMPAWALLFSQFANRVLLSLVELAVLFGFSWSYFDLTVQGSWLALVLLVLAGNFAFAGIAILMASRTASTTVGNGLVNIVTLPMMVLSGIFFSYQNFPEWSWTTLSFLPLTLLADGMRAVINEGAGVFEVAGTLGLLTAIGLGFALLGLRSFKWH